MTLDKARVHGNAGEWPQNLLVSCVVISCLFSSAVMNYYSVHDSGPFKYAFLLLRYSPYLLFPPVLNYFPLLSAFLILPAFLLSGSIFLDALANFSRLQNRAVHKKILLNSAILCSLCLVAAMSLQVVRHHGFVALTERSKPLIAAISAFENKYSRAPQDLDQLVPEFLPAVPGTGMETYPNYEYRAFPGLVRGGWLLSVSCYLNPINGDEFFYAPHSKKIGSVPGGYNEQIGDWVYFHE